MLIDLDITHFRNVETALIFHGIHQIPFVDVQHSTEADG